VCGSKLVLPEIASGFKVPQATDCVCLKCERRYRWTKENPPRLTPLVAVKERYSDAQRDDQS